MSTKDKMQEIARQPSISFWDYVALVDRLRFDGFPFYSIDERDGIRFRCWPPDFIDEMPEPLRTDAIDENRRSRHFAWGGAPAELVAFVDGDPFGALWLPDAFIDEARRHAQSGAGPAARNEALLKEKEAWIADGKQVKDFLAAKAVESKVGTEEIRRRIKVAVSRRGKPLDNSGR